ncbi:MAG: Dienelactone hydrolase family [Micavibrio sp.]|nr:Dienelactone hydrolase family [Micavibrio sp.]
MTEMIIPSKDGKSFTAYVAMPAVLPAPTIIMIQEIFGVNAEMRKKCDAMAAKGYIAVAPDLFWRLEPGVQLTDKTKEEWTKAFALYNAFDVETGIDDLRATAHTFRGHAESTGQVGCVGFCLGGKLAYMMSTHTNIDVSVSYYGAGIDAMLDEVKSIKTPLLMHLAEEDKFISKDAQAKIKEGLAGNPNVTLYSYPGVDHAFTRINGEHYDEAATKLAHQRTDDFLKHHLKQAKAA